MDGFTLIDGIVAAVILVSAVLAWSRGVVREVMAIAGWVVAAIAAFVLAPALEPWMREIPVVGDFLADSCELSVIAAFATVFAVALVVAALFTPVLSSMIRRTALGGLDMGLGFLFGAVRGVLLVAVALIAYERAVAPGTMPMIDNSRSAAVLSDVAVAIEGAIPDDAPNWIVQRYEELVAVCIEA
ncbi:CvpA family protein [Rhodobaculum claviforme]|uniref:Colicin V production CvpA n=1 Tax=Rhodobaculum claviforme TaxID=1549854 RepID=A0A934WKN7_9RHOB|nr:CvpA family protein [Rhodobaculum claviforme]MBK5928753.1 colicin V production CvpA [Rhodobaculum claviforme]